MVLFRLVRTLSITALIAALVFGAGCHKADNSPQQLANQFIKSIGERNQQALDTLLAWDKVAINQYYVGRDHFNRLSLEGQGEVLDSYKELFFTDYLPAASAASYTIDKVYINRDVSNAIIVYESPSQPLKSAEGKNRARKHFTLEMSLYPDRDKWYIVDLNEFIQLNVLRGDYNPEKFYLPEPIP